jgi:hypothetical protein
MCTTRSSCASELGSGASCGSSGALVARTCTAARRCDAETTRRSVAHAPRSSRRSICSSRAMSKRLHRSLLLVFYLWLARLPSLPPVVVDAGVGAEFAALADVLLAGRAIVIPEPRLGFLRWLAENRPVVFHGSRRDTSPSCLRSGNPATRRSGATSRRSTRPRIRSGRSISRAFVATAAGKERETGQWAGRAGRFIRGDISFCTIADPLPRIASDQARCICWRRTRSSRTSRSRGRSSWHTSSHASR